MTASAGGRGGSRVSKVDYVLARLRGEIERGEIGAGVPVRQLEIAARYG
ncbi:hypothetical protein [Aeromicrobium sp. UC242_57]